MKKRGWRWLLFLAAAGFLAKSILGGATPLSIGGFFVSGGLWYWLTWRKTRELDSPTPYKPPPAREP